jgi:predicted HTH transcriptional regulator
MDLNFRNYNEALQRLVTDDGIDAADVIKMLHDGMEKFYVDEGPLHDYKKEYPFSASDNVFGSIMRLICALHNSYGGVIIFGVHNEEKTAGKNKVLVDSEKNKSKNPRDFIFPS